MESTSVVQSAEQLAESPSVSGQCGSSASSPTSDGGSLDNNGIYDLLIMGKHEQIILDLLPLAKKIGRKTKDEYSVAVECLVECVNKLEELPHRNYIQYIAKCIRGRVQTHRANLSVVPVPQWWYRMLKKLNREEELKYKFIDYQNFNESPELVTEYMYSDIAEIIESKLNKVELHVLHGKVCGFTDSEIGAEIKVSQQYIHQVKTELMEKLRRILRDIES
ncbi:MAG TPA: hypothetical protein PLE74_01015 [Candidatus Cloacimonadota bacterium]|nr:hypothetical protein [Candidatus Cloacimonadota bacterium]